MRLTEKQAAVYRELVAEYGDASEAYAEMRDEILPNWGEYSRPPTEADNALASLLGGYMFMTTLAAVLEHPAMLTAPLKSMTEALRFASPLNDGSPPVAPKRPRG